MLFLYLYRKVRKSQMMSDKKSNKLDTSTEHKIKAAAKQVFYRKGFAATRTRDIAEEAGINLALLNYYFRSKQKLFNIIMLETLSGFVENLVGVLNDEKTNLETKVELITSKYIDFIIKEPEVPVFIMSEIRNNPEALLEKLPVNELLTTSTFALQYRKAIEDGKMDEPNPLHFLINLIALVIFPFISKPLLVKIGSLDDIEFQKLMLARKKLIPKWIKRMMITH